MKRFVSVVLCFALILALVAACAGSNMPLTAAELLDLGEKCLLEQKYDQALVYFLKVIEVEQMNPRGYTGAAEAYIGLGKEKAAYEILEHGLAVIGNSPEIQKMIDALLQSGLEIDDSQQPSPDFSSSPPTLPELSPEPSLSPSLSPPPESSPETSTSSEPSPETSTSPESSLETSTSPEPSPATSTSPESSPETSTSPESSMQPIIKPTEKEVATAYLEILKREGTPVINSWGSLESGVASVSIVDINNDQIPELVYSRAFNGEYNLQEYDVVVYGFVSTECLQVIQKSVGAFLCGGGFSAFLYDKGKFIIEIQLSGGDPEEFSSTFYTYSDIFSKPTKSTTSGIRGSDYDNTPAKYWVEGKAVSQKEYNRVMDNMRAGAEYYLTGLWTTVPRGVKDISMSYSAALRYLTNMRGN